MQVQAKLTFGLRVSVQVLLADAQALQGHRRHLFLPTGTNPPKSKF